MSTRTAEIPLSRGLVAIVDAGDAAIVVASGPWHAHPGQRTVYAQRNRRRADGSEGWTSQSLHQFLTGWQLVDHINGNGLDNRRANLRPATSGGNAANRPPRKDSASGFKGVFPNPRGKPWRAQICVSGKKRHLGLFHSPEEAAHAYDRAAHAAWGEFARLNFPEEIA